MLPAVAQGAIGIEIREGDTALAELLAPLDDPATAVRVAAERACLAELDGSCHTPIAALAEAAAGEAAAGGDRLRLRALIALPDGSAVERDERHGPASAAAALGRAAGVALKARAAPTFFRAAG
jgi:hydroxymethylbilane synthase